MSRLGRIAVVAFAVAVTVPAHAAQQKRTFHGTLAYRERGPLAQPGGILHAFFVPASGGLAIARFQRGFQALLGNPKAAGENPGTKGVNDVLVNSLPFDLRLPIRAGYSADLDFELEPSSSEADVYELKSGTIRWQGSNNSDLETGGGNNRHVLKDSVHDGGTAALDPAESHIKLTFNKKDRTYTLDVDVKHPSRPSGTSVWRSFNESTQIMEMKIEFDRGSETWTFKMLGTPPAPPERREGGNDKRGLSYSVTRPIDQLEATETYRTVVDDQVVVNYSLATECKADIVLPSEGLKWIFDDKQPGVLEGEVRAAVVPKGYGEDLEWTLPEIPGSELTTDPEDRKGASVRFKYKGMPKRDAFASKYKVKARFTKNTDKCEDPSPVEQEIFFSRAAKNNESAGVVGQDRANYHFLWFPHVMSRMPTPTVPQPRAAKLSMPAPSDPFRSEPATAYGGSRCGGGTYGYYLPGAGEIHICDLGGVGFAFRNELTGRAYEGIDTFGTSVLHEWTHYEHYWNWQGQADADRDGVPDDVEQQLGMNPNLTHSGVIPGVGRIAGQIPAYLSDEEVLTFVAMDAWRIGSADKDDKACPGKQCREGGR